MMARWVQPRKEHVRPLPLTSAVNQTDTSFCHGFPQNWKPDQSERLLHLFSSSMHIQHHYPTILESACDVDSLIWLWYQGTTIWSHLAASVRPFWKFSTLGPSKNKLFAPCPVAASATSPRCFETTFSEHMMHSLLWSFN